MCSPGRIESQPVGSMCTTDTSPTNGAPRTHTHAEADETPGRVRADMASNPRVKNGHRRRELRARVLTEETHCGICGGLVDKTLHHLDPLAPEVDEIIPVSLGGDPLARGNTRLAHRPPGM